MSIQKYQIQENTKKEDWELVQKIIKIKQQQRVLEAELKELSAELKDKYKETTTFLDTKNMCKLKVCHMTATAKRWNMEYFNALPQHEKDRLLKQEQVEECRIIMGQLNIEEEE